MPEPSAMKISHETKRAKKIIVELVREAGGQFQNKTNLFKAFWKAHLAYATNNPGYLSTWPIVRMPNGPGIEDFDYLVSEMLADGWLTLDETQVGPYQAMVFSLGPNCPPPSLSTPAVEAIRLGVQMVDGKSAAAVSDESHRQSRVWREAKDGEELDIYLDLLDDTERDRLERDFASLSGAITLTYATSRK
jgi:hypothetical protein